MNSPEEEPTDDELADLMDDGASDGAAQTETRPSAKRQHGGTLASW